MEDLFNQEDQVLNDYPDVFNDDFSSDDDIFGDDPKEPEKPEDNNEPDNGDEPQSQYNEDDDTLTSYLKLKGISDPTKIKFRNETGEIEEVDFNSLSKEEQLELLQNMEDQSDLTDDEIETINFLRKNNLSLNDFVIAQQRKAVEAYQNSQQVVTSIDQLSDEELFVLDLRHRYPELNKEELASELEAALEDENLFKKKISKLRDDYTALEKQQQEEAEQQEKQERDAKYQQLVNTMVDVAQNQNDFFGLELDDNDKEEVLQFLLTKDVNGNSQFSKVLNDPRALFNIAFFALKGPEAFQTLHSYYRKEIDKARTNRGTSQPTKKVVKKPTQGKGEDPYGIWS